jgi:NADPH:quinone reductase-like Zn-dependent oxidoreductase
MRAVVLHAVPSRPEFADVDNPNPAVDELLVRVAASSVNGFDAATAAGYLQQMMEHRFPLIPGKDFAGTVAAVGAEVTAYAVGDAVFGVVMKPVLGTGAMAEYVTVPAAYGVTRIPDGLSMTDAGALGLAGTAALNSVDALGLDKGEAVYVCGATGGVGAFAVQFAVARGARVLATARPGAESDFVRGLTDADVHLIDYTGDVAGQVRQVVPDGVDAVLHLAGDATQLTGLVRPGGRIASTLGFGPQSVGDADVTAVSVIADPTPNTLARLAADAAAGTIRVPITATYALEEAAEGFAAFGPGALGKLAIVIQA